MLLSFIPKYHLTFRKRKKGKSITKHDDYREILQRFESIFMWTTTTNVWEPGSFQALLTAHVKYWRDDITFLLFHLPIAYLHSIPAASQEFLCSWAILNCLSTYTFIFLSFFIKLSSCVVQTHMQPTQRICQHVFLGNLLLNLKKANLMHAITVVFMKVLVVRAAYKLHMLAILIFKEHYNHFISNIVTVHHCSANRLVSEWLEEMRN